MQYSNILHVVAYCNHHTPRVPATARPVMTTTFRSWFCGSRSVNCTCSPGMALLRQCPTSSFSRMVVASVTFRMMSPARSPACSAGPLDRITRTSLMYSLVLVLGTLLISIPSPEAPCPCPFARWAMLMLWMRSRSYRTLFSKSRCSSSSFRRSSSSRACSFRRRSNFALSEQFFVHR